MELFFRAIIIFFMLKNNAHYAAIMLDASTGVFSMPTIMPG